MTKSILQQIKTVYQLLEHLSETDGKNQNLNTVYRNTIESAMDEVGMLINSTERHMEVFTHLFWNDELADNIQKNIIPKDQTFRATIDKNIHEEFSLALDCTSLSADLLEYHNYLTKEEAMQDVIELERLGYKIV